IYYTYHLHLHLHSFPTRRSSDLTDLIHNQRSTKPSLDHISKPCTKSGLYISSGRRIRGGSDFRPSPLGAVGEDHRPANTAAGPRSEEHTSELQSRVELVCRLLLE